MLRLVSARIDNILDIVIEEDTYKVCLNKNIFVEFTSDSEGHLSIAGPSFDSIILTKNETIFGSVFARKFKRINSIPNSGRFEYSINQNVEVTICYQVDYCGSTVRYELMLMFKYHETECEAKIVFEIDKDNKDEQD